jgi:succinoglycan biosynthesis transport protein ExoP
MDSNHNNEISPFNPISPAALGAPAGDALVDVPGAVPAPLKPIAGGAPTRSAEGSLWRSFQRRWLLALTIGLTLGAAAATATWILRPAKYSTFALVRIDSERPEVLPRDRVVNDLELYRMTQMALIKSPKVLDAVLRQDKIRQLSLVTERPDPATWLENALAVEPVRDTELLRVSLNSLNADEAAVLVNAVVQAYLQEVVNRDQKQRLDRLKDLKEVCEKSEESLRRQRKKLQGVAESLKANDHETATLRQKIALEEYVALRKELIKLGSELRQASRGEGDGIRGAAAESPVLPAATIELAVDEHVNVQAEVKKLALAEEALAKIKAIARPGYHGLVDAERKVAAARESVEAVRGRVRRGMEEKIQKRAEAEARLAETKRTQREALMKEQYEAVWKEVEERRKAADQIGLSTILYEIERSEIDQAEKIIKSLWAERERLEVEGRSHVQRISIELEATPSRTKQRKPQILAAGLTGFTFCFAAAFAVSFWDYRARRIYSRDEVVEGLRLRVLGSLPVLMEQPSANQSRRQLKYAYWGHLWTEAINGIRTVLLHEANQHSLQVVMVTSAAPQEGKTTLASHLSISLAAAGRRTLLIDADLRRPLLHNVFAAPPAPGLCEVLSEECGSAAAIQPTSIAGLDLLPAGTFRDAVLPLLAQGRLEALLRVLRTQYQTIVIDSSPIMAVNDALLVGHHVDAVLLSIRPSRSRVPMVQEACDRLRSLDIPVLGTVLNGALAGHQDLVYRYVSPAGPAPVSLAGAQSSPGSGELPRTE